MGKLVAGLVALALLASLAACSGAALPTATPAPTPTATPDPALQDALLVVLATRPPDASGYRKDSLLWVWFENASGKDIHQLSGTLTVFDASGRALAAQPIAYHEYLPANQGRLTTYPANAFGAELYFELIQKGYFTPGVGVQRYAGQIQFRPDAIRFAASNYYPVEPGAAGSSVELADTGNASPELERYLAWQRQRRAELADTGNLSQISQSYVSLACSNCPSVSRDYLSRNAADLETRYLVKLALGELPASERDFQDYLKSHIKEPAYGDPKADLRALGDLLSNLNPFVTLQQQALLDYFADPRHQLAAAQALLGHNLPSYLRATYEESLSREFNKWAGDPTNNDKGFLQYLFSSGYIIPETPVPARSIFIVSPTNNAVIHGDSIRVEVATSGLTMDGSAIGKANVPGRGHWHLYLDGNYIGSSAGTVIETAQIPPSDHVIRVSLHNNDHSAVNPPIETYIRVELIAP